MLQGQSQKNYIGTRLLSRCSTYRIVDILQLCLLVPDEPGVPNDGVLLPALRHQVLELAVLSHRGPSRPVSLGETDIDRCF